MRLFPLFLVVLLVSCEGEGIIGPTGEIDTPFDLKLGQSITLIPDGIEVGFERVLGDSRCPSNVVCVWEGVAHLRLWLLRPGSDTVFVTAPIYGYVTKTDTARHVAVEAMGYWIKVLQLDPYPTYPPPLTRVYLASIKVSTC